MAVMYKLPPHVNSDEFDYVEVADRGRGIADARRKRLCGAFRRKTDNFYKRQIDRFVDKKVDCRRNIIRIPRNTIEGKMFF